MQTRVFCIQLNNLLGNCQPSNWAGFFVLKGSVNNE